MRWICPTWNSAAAIPSASRWKSPGSVRNSADVLSLEMTARTTLDAVCDRCGKEFLQDKEITYSCMLAEELQNEDNDEIVLLTDGEVDLGDLARTAFTSEWTQNSVLRRLQGALPPVRC